MRFAAALLTLIALGGCDAVDRAGPPPWGEVTISANPATGSVPLVVQFTAGDEVVGIEDGGSAVSWSWNLGEPRTTWFEDQGQQVEVLFWTDMPSTVQVYARSEAGGRGFGELTVGLEEETCPEWSAPMEVGLLEFVEPVALVEGQRAGELWALTADSLHLLAVSDAEPLGSWDLGVLGDRELRDLARTGDGNLLLADVGGGGEEVHLVQVVEPVGEALGEVTDVTAVFEGGAVTGTAAFVDPALARTYVFGDDERIWTAEENAEAWPAYRLNVIEQALDLDGQLPTGADLSGRGNHVAVRTEDEVWVFRRPGLDYLPLAFASEPCVWPLPSGTAGVAVSRDETALFVAQQSPPALVRLDRLNLPDLDD